MLTYENEIIIHLPRSKVIELFDNSDNMKAWQPTLLSFEHVDGKPGTSGAKSKLKYKMGKREMEMIETILVRNLPNEFTAAYEAKGTYNESKNLFIKRSDKETLWQAHNVFKVKGFMWILTKIIPGSFKRQTQKHMEDFKKFAENAK